MPTTDRVLKSSVPQLPFGGLGIPLDSLIRRAERMQLAPHPRPEQQRPATTRVRA